MFQNRRNFVFMAAMGAALSAGAAAVATAFDTAEKFVVTGALKVTHLVTEQVCDFDTLDQLEDYLAAVADRHDWFRHDQPAAAPETVGGNDAQLAAAAVADQIDTTAAQVDSLAQGPAPVAGITVSVDLEQLRADVAADTAAQDATAPEAPAAIEQPATIATDTAA